MRRSLLVLAVVVLIGGVVTGMATGLDRPFSTSELVAAKWRPDAILVDMAAGIGQSSGQFSKVQWQRFRCDTSGNPATAVAMSCSAPEFGQSYSPDNEIGIAVDPNDPNHLVAGSNDYYYRFNNATGSRGALVPTGFFTSFDGGASWLDGQVPTRSGNGAGDPAPAFDGKHGVALMAQLENVGGAGGPYVSQGDVSVSQSTDGGVTWQSPVTVMMGTGTGIGPANQAVFWDKEWLACDNSASSPHYGRCYLTATRFLNGLQGSYAESPIYLSTSDDGGRRWTPPREISGSSADLCELQSTGPAGECDEDQFSIPAIASNGTVYVHFLNGQDDQVSGDDVDSQVLVVKSTDGGTTFSAPVRAATLEDGYVDMPFSVIGRQTIWGHQIRWTPAGNVAVDPTNPDRVAVVFSDRGIPNVPSDPLCFLTDSGGLEIGNQANGYDPCGAGQGADTDVYLVESIDGGATWSSRQNLSGADGGVHEWFPWAGFKPDGTLVVAWDRDDVAPGAGPTPANDTFRHVLKIGTGGPTPLGAAERVDDSLTHWAGQYVPESRWPTVCGGTPAGKGCNVFHGDYTGLAVGSDGTVNVVWTGLNRLATSDQIDPYTGGFRTGYKQDAMFARR